MHITDDIRYIGVNDHKIDLFEAQYAVPDGMAYNSYVILDEKIAVMDSVDGHFAQAWLGRLRQTLGSRTPDYLIVQHMEPDHSGSVAAFMEAYPEATIAASCRAFAMMEAFLGTDYAARRLVVGEGDTLSLGAHTLTFIAAPMVHWPEVIMTYDFHDKALFSADAFGAFGALDAQIDWAQEARRYYFGIVGKYGAQVQALLKKVAALDIARICPLHGPVLCENLSYYLNLYNIWSSYRAETPGAVVAYASVYGGTQKAAELLGQKLREKGCSSVVLYDLARCDMAAAVADAFRYDTLVLACTTYNADLFPAMRAFIHLLTERNFQRRKVALIENGSWAPVAAKVMRGMLEGCKNLTFADACVRIIAAPGREACEQIDALAQELCT